MKQDQMLRDFAQDLFVRHKRPRVDDFDFIEAHEAVAWFDAGGDHWFEHLCACCKHGSDKQADKLAGLLRLVVSGDLTLDQATELRDVLRALLIDEAARQVRKELEDDALLYVPGREEP